MTVDDKENITLGAWQILPTKLLSNVVDNHHYNYEEILKNTNYSILLYLHGNGGIRSVPLDLYSILRKFFQVIAIDYRGETQSGTIPNFRNFLGYGDSTKAELTEDNIVRDIVNFYIWLRGKTQARIFFWGHSLGTGVSTHTISNLKVQNHVPSGLVLETPFSSVPDVMEDHFFVKVLLWRVILGVKVFCS